MKVIGGGNIRFYGKADEGSHAFGAQAWWQESVFLLWYDLKADVGGMHRIGHEPHLDQGSVVLWNYFFTGDGDIHVQNEIMPIRDEDRISHGFGGGPSCRFEYDDCATWIFEGEQAKGRLKVEDFHQPLDLFPPDAGTLADDFAKNHLEASGRVSGQVTIGGRMFDVDAIGYRDHSWGVRVWQTLLTHRWVAGVFGPELSFGAVSWLAEDGTLRKFGYVIRGKQVIYADDVDIVVALEADGITHRGGVVRMRLADGEDVTINATPLVKGVVSFHHGNACLDTLCKVTMGDEVGICDFEMSNNSQRGYRRPSNLLMGMIDNGFHRGHALSGRDGNDGLLRPRITAASS